MAKHIFASFMLVLTLATLPSPLLAGEVTLFAAASLKEALNEIADHFSKTQSSLTIKRNYGGSGTLAKQIDNGAPADIFVSANTVWVDYLKGKNLTDQKAIEIFAYNILVFAGKPDLKVSGLQDVVKLGKVAIGSPKSVPAGEYAMTAFRKAGIEKQLANRLVLAKDVRECLMYAERGEVDGSFVYKTDAEQAARTTKIHFAVPQDLYPRVTYPMALTADGARNAAAVAFFSALKRPDAKSILKKHGFIVH